MDVARRVFACFDQPDLKAPFRVEVVGRPGWQVIANGTGEAEGQRWTFTTTPPIATYLVAVCAGPFASSRWEHRGQRFGWHCRASQAEDLDRDIAQLRSVTETAFDRYADMFTEPYAFGDYDQVLVPGHNWGAMETPGVVTFRDEMLPRGSTDVALARSRAMVVAHEMAHMWFGDLVTFRWWEDTWLNESFADLMGFVVGGSTLPGHAALAEFDIARKAGAYAADERPSSHPVAPRAEDVPDVDTAFNNFDAISYAKGNSALRQLSFWLGEETFLAGVDRHLTTRRFGTATLDDLVVSLEAVTDRDVRGWVDAWLRTTGHDTLQVVRDGERAVLRLHGSRPHTVRVTGYDRAGDGAGDDRAGDGLVRAWEEVVDLGGADGPDEVALPPADLVVPNSTGDTFARVVLDDGSLAVVDADLGRVPDEHPRVILWATLLDAAARGDLAADRLVLLVQDHLPGDPSPVVVEHVLGRARRTVLGASAGHAVPALLDRLAAVSLALLGEDAPALPTAVAEAATEGVIEATHDTGLLRAWLADGAPSGPLAPTRRWAALGRLSALGEDVTAMVEAELAADGSSAARLGSLTAAAAAPVAAAKEHALTKMLAEGTSNRELTALAAGLWDAEHRDLVDPLVTAYLEQAPALAARGQAIALVVGRAAPGFRWTANQLAALEAATGGRGLPPVLARTWADLLHDQRQLAGEGSVGSRR